MKNELKCFFENLIMQYSRREDINHIHYDGETEPIRSKNNPSIRILSEDTSREIYKWAASYISRRDQINYYEMYQHFVNTFYNLWVNPTLNELTIWNKQMDLFPTSNLKNTECFEREWKEKIHKKLLFELEAEGYTVSLGSELIEHLVRSYDNYATENISIVDWIKPADVSLLENNQSYIVDSEIITKPILLSRQHIIERDNQDFPITKMNLRFYLENILVTKRGIDSEELEEDSRITFNFYNNMEEYLECVVHEQRETTLRKLLNDAVNPSLPFVEAVIEDYGEVYINNQALRTEKDIIDFVNMAYILEEVDREVKSFDRKKILESIMCMGLSNNGNLTLKRRDSIH